MVIMHPEVSIYREKDHLTKIETIARVCTGTQSKTGTRESFVDDLWTKGHETPFEHVRIELTPEQLVHLTWGRSAARKLFDSLFGRYEDTYGQSYRITSYGKEHKDPENGAVWHSTVFSMNGRDYLNMGGTLKDLASLPEATDYMTVRFDYPIALSREQVRHREDSFQEMSTRWVKMADGLVFSKPQCFDLDEADVKFLQSCEDQYKRCISKGMSAQQARMFLPLMTRTTLYVTATIEQWKHVLKLRLDKAADPEMQKIMQTLVALEDCPVELKNMLKG